MGSSTESVRVIIYGEEYSIKGDADVETTKKVAEYVNGKMEEIQNRIASRDKAKIAVLAALNIAGELLGIEEDLRKKAGAISKKIDENVEIE
jgi:cell division protein ZapA